MTNLLFSRARFQNTRETLYPFLKILPFFPSKHIQMYYSSSPILCNECLIQLQYKNNELYASNNLQLRRLNYLIYSSEKMNALNAVLPYPQFCPSHVNIFWKMMFPLKTDLFLFDRCLSLNLLGDMLMSRSQNQTYNNPVWTMPKQAESAFSDSVFSSADK